MSHVNGNIGYKNNHYLYRNSDEALSDILCKLTMVLSFVAS
ncbi:hypothetical protein [Candidatus Schmidhempelia bombi]|nr:hypothetical protein [Candidatus Schmidhempelia bombi]